MAPLNAAPPVRLLRISAHERLGRLGRSGSDHAAAQRHRLNLCGNTLIMAEEDDLLDVLNTLDDPEYADQYILWCGYRPHGPDQARQDEVAVRVRQHNERVLARSVSERKGDRS